MQMSDALQKTAAEKWEKLSALVNYADRFNLKLNFWR